MDSTKDDYVKLKKMIYIKLNWFLLALAIAYALKHADCQTTNTIENSVATIEFTLSTDKETTNPQVINSFEPVTNVSISSLVIITLLSDFELQNIPENDLNDTKITVSLILEI